MKEKKLKYYEITRTVIEVFGVDATSKEEAKILAMDPHTVTVIKETIKTIK